jgi:hypothetical protein
MTDASAQVASHNLTIALRYVFREKKFLGGFLTCVPMYKSYNLDTNFMELSPSREAASYAATEELSNIFIEPEGSLPYSLAIPFKYFDLALVRISATNIIDEY